MKVRSLLLGSVAAAGLATGGAYAADLGVLTSLDVCDNLGLSGLTISSDTNCLQITGEVKYKLTWGDYSGIDYVGTPQGYVGWDADANDNNNWESRFDAWLKFVATADSDFGPAKAVIKLKQASQVLTSVIEVASSPSSSGTASSTGISGTAGVGTVTVSTFTTGAGSASSYTYLSSSVGGSDTDGVIMDEAYVSIGEGTVISAGKKGSLFNDGDDAPLSWLGLFNSSKVDVGVGDDVGVDTGGVVIQITSDLGNGFSVGAALEDLGGSDQNGIDSSDGGTFVGVLAYSGDGISAHASFAADGVLAGEIDEWTTHAGFTGTFDNFKVVAAAAFDSSEYWNVLAGASVTLDMFTLAGDVEAASEGDYVGAGASITAAIADGVTLNVGGRWASYYSDEGYQVAVGVTAALSETLKMTGEVGYVSSDYSSEDLFYGSAKLDWAPGGGTFTSSVKGTIFSEGGYKIESEFKKSFQ
jgi:hypothetical protein